MQRLPRDCRRGGRSEPAYSIVQDQVTGGLDEASCALLTVWPSQRDLDIIAGVPMDLSVVFHGVVCMPYAEFYSSTSASPRSMLQLPPHDSHPVLLARRLLMLGILLQSVQPSSVGVLSGLSSDYRELMSSVVNTASKLVTSNDELVTSLEGVECIMMESMFLNNAGNLRRAWLKNRRAMVLGQMMGLHKGTSSPNTTILEAETRNRIDPDYLWSRLVFSDRYLSLMLGLPQASTENIFARPEALAKCAPIECMERMMAVAGDLILQRNSNQRSDLALTHEVDEMLREAATLMPPKWWLLTPESTSISDNDQEKAFDESLRLINHFTHRHLLVQLHLPYTMLPSSLDPRIDYSKMTAANASRAILSQYVYFRSSGSATAYCRGIDFIAFIASTTLCLVHMDARRQEGIDNTKCVGVLLSLRHLRPSDRGLLECTLEIMDAAAQQGQDVIAQKISRILRPLLVIEGKSAGGLYYKTSVSSEVNPDGSEAFGDTDATFSFLRIQVPYFGTVQIHHCPTVSDCIQPAETAIDKSTSDTFHADLFAACEPGPQHTGYAFSTLQPANADWHTVPSYLDPAELPRQPEPAASLSGLSSFGAGDTQESRLLVPGLAVEVDEWALQGVDTALFSSLKQGFTGTKGKSA